MRAGTVTATSCATMPPKLTPTIANVSHPTWSTSASSVGRVVGHRVRPGWDLGTAQTPLVRGKGVGRLGERFHQQAGGGERGARRVEEQQRVPVAGALEVDVDAVEASGGHRRTLSATHSGTSPASVTRCSTRA